MSVLQLFLVCSVLTGSGYPLAAAILRHRSLSERLLMALPIGTALTTLVLQLFGKLGVPIAPVARIWAAAALATGFLVWRAGRTPDAVRISRRDLLPVGTAISLTLLLGALPLVSRGGRFYTRAWGDQLNYSLMANYLLHGSPKPSDISRPDLRIVPPARYLDDRPGDGVMLASVTAVTFSDDVSSTYYYCGVVSVLCWFAGTYILLRRWSRSAIAATGVGVLVALAPPLHVIYLESYMGQAMASCLFLAIICLAAELIESSRWPALVALALCLGFVFATYFEFYGFAVMTVAACMGGRIGITRRVEFPRMRMVAPAAAIGLALLVNLPGAQLASRLRQLAQSAGSFPTLAVMYPWAFQPEGMSRLILGDLAASLPRATNLIVATLVVGLTAYCLFGVWRAYRTDRAAEAVSILALLLLPIGIVLLPGRRPYAFYKLVQSFWPLCFLGLPQLHKSWLPRSVPIFSRWAPVALGTVLAVATARMLWVERGFGPGSPRSGMNGYLAENSFESVRKLLAPIASRPIYVVYPTPVHFRDWLANGWFLLFASRWTNDITNEFANLGDHAVPVKSTANQAFDLETPSINAPPKRLLEPSAEAYVVQLGTLFVEPAPDLFRLAAQQGRMRLYRQANRDWVFAHFVFHPAYKEFLSLENGATISTADHLRIDFQSAIDRPNGMTLSVTVAGPGEIHLYTSFPFGIVVPLDSRTGTTEIPTGPFHKGMTQVMLRALAPGDDPAHATRSLNLHIDHIQYQERIKPL